MVGTTIVTVTMVGLVVMVAVIVVGTSLLVRGLLSAGLLGGSLTALVLLLQLQDPAGGAVQLDLILGVVVNDLQLIDPHAVVPVQLTLGDVLLARLLSPELEAAGGVTAVPPDWKVSASVTLGAPEAEAAPRVMVRVAAFQPTSFPISSPMARTGR